MTEEQLLSLNQKQLKLIFSKSRYIKTLRSLEELMIMFTEKTKISGKIKKSILQDFKDLEKYINDLIIELIYEIK